MKGPTQLFLALSLYLLTLVGCGPNPGQWPQEKVAAHLSESLELQDVSLTKTAEGYNGSGMRSDGEKLTFTVTQDPTARKISWDAKGDRGFVEQGSFQIN